MTSPARVVFLSYTSQDADAARRLHGVLRAAGIEVWFDQSELRGGDVWDAMIRRRIKTCSLFMPILSRNSHERAEGYFRLEWKLAIDRSHLIAADRAFLVPVVIDATSETDDRVPERFREVQWLRAPDGRPPAGFADHIKALLARSVATEPSAVAKLVQQVAGAHSVPSDPAAAPASPPSRAARLAWAGAALLAVAIGLIAVWRFAGHEARVAPYSLADRRMTFAVLPFQAPADDDHALRVARASTDAILANLEGERIFAHTAPRSQVVAVLKRATGLREIAEALNVHFLIRGTVAHAPAGYSLSLGVVDGSTERALASETLPIDGDALVPRWEDDIDTAVFHLLMAGMHNEVEKIADRPPADLDVRDLSFRALDEWRAHRGPEAQKGYVSASDLLSQALRRAPDDALATYLTAEINLCDCIMAWSTNPEEQRRIGSEALERYLRIDPTDPEMLMAKASIYQYRGRYEEALVIANALLQRHPGRAGAIALAAVSLVHLGRAREALTQVDGLAQRYSDNWPYAAALAADVHYAVGDYAGAAALAGNAAARMSDTDLKSPVTGPVRLTLAAAEARLGHADRASHAWEDFLATVPHVDSVAAVRKWMVPVHPLTGFEPLYAGLRLAGVPD